MLQCLCVFLVCLDDSHKRIALVGNQLSFTCMSNISVSARGFILDEKHQLGSSNEADELYKKRNITWQYTTGEGVETWHLSILASEKNNGTTVQCISMGHISDVDELIVVEGSKFNSKIYIVTNTLWSCL